MSKTDRKHHWRDAKRFTQGERYEVDAADSARWRGARPAILGGLAMIATTIVFMLLGAVAWFGVIAGLIVFAIFIAALRPKAAARPRRQIAGEDAFAAAGLDREEVEAALSAAELELKAIEAASEDIRNADLRSDLSALVDSARDILDSIAADPADLRPARKYLKVYLPSARASVEKFVALGVVNDDALDAKFQSLVAEMIETSRRQRHALDAEDRIDLEVEMDVLAERLAREA